MRLMLNFTIPVEKGNAAAADGSLSKTFDTILSRLEPEAAYFHLRHGKRAGTIIFDETDQSSLPVINETLFSTLDAEIEIQPVLNREDLLKNF